MGRGERGARRGWRASVCGAQRGGWCAWGRPCVSQEPGPAARVTDPLPAARCRRVLAQRTPAPTTVLPLSCSCRASSTFLQSVTSFAVLLISSAVARGPACAGQQCERAWLSYSHGTWQGFKSERNPHARKPLGLGCWRQRARARACAWRSGDTRIPDARARRSHCSPATRTSAISARGATEARTIFPGAGRDTAFAR
jgi:hypothetical protein